MGNFLDLIPWETKPKAIEPQTHSILWNGGELKIPKLGYLSVSELDEVGGVDPKNALNRLLYETAIELHKAIVPSGSKDDPDKEPSPWDPKRCFELLLTLHLINNGARAILSPEEKTIEILHNDIILPFLESAAIHTNRVVIRSVTVILKRIKHDWSDDLTLQLPGELRQSIYAFYQEEQQAGNGNHNPEEDIIALENMLGKPLGVSPLTATESTGEKPTGSAENTGQAAQNLVESNSEVSPATTSSRPSKRAGKPKEKGFTTKNEPSHS